MVAEIAVFYKVLGTVAGVFGFLIMGHVWWLAGLKKSIEDRLQKNEDKVEGLLIKQIKHESTFVTEQRTREVFKEEIEPISKDVNNLKEVVSEVRGVVMGVIDKVSALVTEVRIINAIRESKKDKE